MANVVRARVELKRKYNDPDKNFKDMLQEFRRRVSQAGILKEYREHQYFESESEKERKRLREASKRTLVEALKKRIQSGERVLVHPGLVKKIQADLMKEKKDKGKKDRRQHRHYDD